MFHGVQDGMNDELWEIICGIDRETLAGYQKAKFLELQRAGNSPHSKSKFS